MRELNSMEIDAVAGGNDVADGAIAVAGAVALVATAPVSVPVLLVACAMAAVGGYLLAS